MATDIQLSVDLSEDRGGYMITSVITVLVLAVVSTALRLVARQFQKQKYNISDYTIIVALICGICGGSIVFTGVYAIKPFNQNSLSISNTVRTWKTYAGCETIRLGSVSQGE